MQVGKDEMNFIYRQLFIVKLESVRAVILLGSLLLAACSQTTKTAENASGNYMAG